eukprot:7488-Heterococcus_DN1.PRE.1
MSVVAVARCAAVVLYSDTLPSEPDGEDPLLAEASKLEDEFYEVTFETKQPLGVVLERSKEWAVVKLANPALSAVTVGSALAAVNGKSVVLKPYHTTIDLLTNWRPPLHLRSVLNKVVTARTAACNARQLPSGAFSHLVLHLTVGIRTEITHTLSHCTTAIATTANCFCPHTHTRARTHRAPEKSGWLKKQKTAPGTVSGVSLVDAVGGPGGRPKLKWKPLFFILAEGKLSWFNADGRDAKLQGVVLLAVASTGITGASYTCIVQAAASWCSVHETTSGLAVSPGHAAVVQCCTHLHLSEVPMMGSAVSLLPFKEAGQHFCLSMVSGITTLALQLLSSSASYAIAGSAAAGLLTACACMTGVQCATACGQSMQMLRIESVLRAACAPLSMLHSQGLTAEDMLDWSTHLYHASAIANGGGYLLDKERSREKAFEEERARRAQARAAELEAAERRQGVADHRKLVRSCSTHAEAAAAQAAQAQAAATAAAAATAPLDNTDTAASDSTTPTAAVTSSTNTSSDSPEDGDAPSTVGATLGTAAVGSTGGLSRLNSSNLALVCLELAHREREAAELAAEQAATAVCELVRHLACFYYTVYTACIACCLIRTSLTATAFVDGARERSSSMLWRSLCITNSLPLRANCVCALYCKPLLYNTTQEYAREQETAAAAAAAKATRERQRLTALEVDAALKDLLARQAVVCAKHDVLQQIADATTATTSSTSSGSRRPSGRRSMDGTSSSTTNGVVVSAPGTLSAAADCSFPVADAATSASITTAGDSSTSSSSRSRRTQSMDLAKMLSGGWNSVTGTDKQSSESLLTVVADVADEETAEIEPAETVGTLATADSEAAHSTDTESEYVVVPLPPAATATTATTADTDTAAGTTAGASLPAVPTSDDSSSTAGTTAARKRSDASLATDTLNSSSSSSSSSSSLRVDSSVFSSSSGAPATPSRSAGPCVSSLVQARTAAEAEAASKRAAAVSERLASAQYKESGARVLLILDKHRQWYFFIDAYLSHQLQLDVCTTQQLELSLNIVLSSHNL